MPPRKTTDFGALFESLIEDLRIQVAASFDQSLSEIEKRITRIEKRLSELDPNQNAVAPEDTPTRRVCSVCGKPSVARGLCSAHYQQWRYRVRKAKAREETEAQSSAPTSAGAGSKKSEESHSSEGETTQVFPTASVSQDN
ncbi:MAG: hypothetical protein AAFQ82_15675 [Myxococcota bacterium]